MPNLITDIHNRDANTSEFGGNPPFRGVEWRSKFNPTEHVYVYNVSGRKFSQFGKLQREIPGVTDDDPTDVRVGDKVLPGKPNERYHYVTSFPQPILIYIPDDQSNMVRTIEQDAVRYVVDLINPDNPTRTLDFTVPPDRQLSIGTNLADKGVFFSMTNPPQREDVRKAYDRLEVYYNRLLETARTLELTDKQKLSEQLAGNPDYSYAATYFGQEYSWNKRQVRPVECPVCGEHKPAGKKFHTPSTGGICVEPTVEAWKLVVQSGRLPYESVPEDFRWKKEKQEKQPVSA